MACEIVLDQGSNLCPPHWQADSQPLDHQGSPLWGFKKSSSCMAIQLNIIHVNCGLESTCAQHLNVWEEEEMIKTNKWSENLLCVRVLLKFSFNSQRYPKMVINKCISHLIIMTIIIVMKELLDHCCPLLSPCYVSDRFLKALHTFSHLMLIRTLDPRSISISRLKIWRHAGTMWKNRSSSAHF